MSRIISSLQWAKWVTNRIPKPPGRGSSAAARAGLAYQRRVTKALEPLGPSLMANPWISFLDAHGPGMAQPDLLLVGAGLVAPTLIEIKLTYTELAVAQLDLLYVPLVAHLFGVSQSQIRRIILCKHLTAAAFAPKAAQECCLEDGVPLGEPPLTTFWSGTGPAPFGVY